MAVMPRSNPWGLFSLYSGAHCVFRAWSRALLKVREILKIDRNMEKKHSLVSTRPIIIASYNHLGHIPKVPGGPNCNWRRKVSPGQKLEAE